MWVIMATCFENVVKWLMQFNKGELELHAEFDSLRHFARNDL